MRRMTQTAPATTPTLSVDDLEPLRHALISHAAQAYPEEACGVIVRGSGTRDRYEPVRNEFTGTSQAGDRFRISAEDWARAEDSGEIIAIVHSHPDACANPTMADRVMCERTGVPWVIVGYPSEAVTVTAPAGFQAPLIGREFHHGVLDCYTLIRDYYSGELGIELPDFEREDAWWEHADHGDLYRAGYAEAGFVLVNDMPRQHDVLLMQVAARCDNHAAVFLGDGTVLHHLYGRLSGREVWGGYWERHTTAVLRHTSLLDARAVDVELDA